MSDLIKVPYTELRSRAATMHTQADAVLAEVNALNDVVSSMQWLGNRADRFMAMWNEAVPAMRHWAAILHDFASDLENQADRIERWDNAPL